MGTDESDPAALTTAVQRWTEVTDFVTQTLKVVQAEISELTAVQAEMASTISGHVRSLGKDPADPTARDHVDSIVVAIQKEDLLRQRHEHMALALGIVAEALESLRRENREAFGEPAGAGRPAAAWSRRLIDTLTLSDVRDKFAAAMDSSPAPPDGAEGNVELF